MQALSKAEVGGNYTIQWLFGLPEVVEFLHRHHVEEGGSVQVIQKLSNGLIIGANGESFAMGKEIADRIQVELQTAIENRHHGIHYKNGCRGVLGKK